MEVTLSHEDTNRIAVFCNGQPSHTFDMQILPPPLGASTASSSPLEDPVAYGTALYEALCAPETLAHQTIVANPERLVLTIEHTPLQALPWEYIYRQQGFLVLDIPFIRSIPVAQRIATPTPTGTLHSAVLLSNPITTSLSPLHTDVEWRWLQQAVEGILNAMTLERIRPPTQQRLTQLLGHRHIHIVHYMSNMVLDSDEHTFPFEHMDGSLDAMSHDTLVHMLQPSSVLMLIVHAGNTPTPAPTPFNMMAANLVARGLPYVLAMHFSMPKDAMHTFAHALYRDIARGLSVEAAVHQARIAVCNSSTGDKNHWAVGGTVLYTALNAPAPGLSACQGEPCIRDHQPRKELSRLPYVEGRLEGRTEELLRLGQWLTGKNKDTDKDRSPILTVLGDFGQGKTTLIREAIERFGHAWTDGIWATSLEDVPLRAKFVNDLGQFLGIATERIDYATEVEHDLLTRLKQSQPLIVLDCAEALIEALHNEHADDHATAQDFMNIIQELLLKRHIHLLVMSRVPLGLAGEETLRIGGLSRAHGARLFALHAGHRQSDVLMTLAEKVSDVVAGNPLCLRLLGGAFATCPLPLSTFVVQLEAQLMQSRSEYRHADRAQQALFACIDTNVRYLSDVLRDILSGLWVFHAPFLPQVAAAVFDEHLHDAALPLPSEQDPVWQQSTVYDHLEALWQRGLLERTYDVEEDTSLFFYRMPTGIRLHAERSLAQAHAYDTLVQRFCRAYASLVRTMYYALHDNPQAAAIAYTCYDDIQRGLFSMQGKQRADYLLHWAWIVAHMDQAGQAYDLTKEALMIYAHSDDDAGQIMALNNMAMLLHTRLHRTEEAIEHIQQARTLLETSRSQDANDYTPELLQHTLEAMQESLQRQQVTCSESSTPTPSNADAEKSATGIPRNTILGTSSTIPQSQIRQIVTNTIAVMTVAKDGHEGWCRVMFGLLDYAQEQGAGWEPEVDFCRAVLALLQPEEADHAASTLPEGHPYAAAIEEIQQQCAAMHPEPQHGTSAIEIQDSIAQTIAVFTTADEQRREWHATVTDKQHQAQQAGDQHQAAFFAAILALLNEQAPDLPDDHPYADALAEIITGIGSCRYQHVAALPSAQMEQIVSDTIAVMSVEPQRHAEWRMSVAAALMRARHWGEQWMPEVEFFTAVLAILDGQSPTLPQNHLYAGLIAEIINGIEQRLRQHVSGEHSASPIPKDVVPRTIAALRGGTEEKTVHVQYLATIATGHTDVQMMILKNNIQMALHGADLATMGKELQGVYREAWDAIVHSMHNPSE